MLDAEELAYITQRYIESIQRIPDDVFPCAGVQDAMVARAEAGETIYAYWTGREYKVYHEQPKIYMQQHYTPEEWARAFGFLDGKEGA